MKLVELPVDSRLDIKGNKVLDEARKHGLKHCVLIGWDEEGGMYFASSYGHLEDTNMQLDLAKWEVKKIWESRDGDT